jgi:hypothetical protein
MTSKIISLVFDCRSTRWKLGDYGNGFSTDIAITVVAPATNLADFYINSDPTASPSVPLGKIDLIPVLEHELATGLASAG